jgi:hypothetical protein
MEEMAMMKRKRNGWSLPCKTWIGVRYRYRSTKLVKIYSGILEKKEIGRI